MGPTPYDIGIPPFQVGMHAESLSSGVVAYLGAFTVDFRNVRKTLLVIQIFFTKNFNTVNIWCDIRRFRDEMTVRFDPY